MGKKEGGMYKLGLIGTPLSHSFSKKYFDIKFKDEKIKNFTYNLYQLEDLKNIDSLISRENIIGLNVTQPYKQKIIKYLDNCDQLAIKTKSVNTIFINPKTNEKIGFNTDVFGFKILLSYFNLKLPNKGLILGSGGVSKTISYVLKKNKIEHKIVSRKPKKNMLNYMELKQVISDFKLIINTTPLGEYPKTDLFPNIPYHLISAQHQCIDLIYNPKKTIFLKKVHDQGAQIINGKKMLTSQAIKAWEIWQKMIKKYDV